MTETSTEIAISPTHRLERVAPKDLQAEAIAIREIQKSVLVEDTDYGIIPGTKKPSLYKAGAEILLKWAQLGYRLSVVEIDRDPEGRKYGVTYRASVYRLDTPDVPLAEADGYCGYDENGRDAHVNDWGKSIAREPWNTIVAMSAKRAVVAATRAATGTSGLFTQDVEDPAYRERSEANGKNGSTEGPPVITAKFDSKCVVCQGPIKKGEKVVYEKGKGAWHPTCDPRSGDGEDITPSKEEVASATVVNKEEAFDPNPQSEKPAGKDAIPGVDLSTRPLLAAVNDLAGKLGLTPQETTNLAGKLFKRNVDLGALSESDAEKFGRELQARWDAKVEKEAK